MKAKKDGAGMVRVGELFRYHHWYYHGITFMKDIKYKTYSFKLNEKTIKKLRKAKPKDKSWNLFFIDLLKVKSKNYERSGKIPKPNNK
jgi:hypothetical protein